MTFSKPSDHHAILVKCRECSRLELGRRMAKTEKEKAQWTKLIEKHLCAPELPGKDRQ